MQAVETVEKVPFRKLIFGKWDKNLEKRLIFCVPNNILAIFEPVVGDFCEDFSSKEFFDSLVGHANTFHALGALFRFSLIKIVIPSLCSHIGKLLCVPS